MKLLKDFIYSWMIPVANDQNAERLYLLYSKTCVKLPLKNRQNKDLNDKW